MPARKIIFIGLMSWGPIYGSPKGFVNYTDVTPADEHTSSIEAAMPTI